MKRANGVCFAVAYLAVVGVALVPAAASQSIRMSGDRITIDAEDVTLAELFTELSERIAVELLQISPEARQLRVSVQVQDVSPVQGIVEILEEAQVDYALAGGRGRSYRILIGSAESNTGRSPSAARPLSSDEPTEELRTEPYRGQPSEHGQTPPTRADSERENGSTRSPETPSGFDGGAPMVSRGKTGAPDATSGHASSGRPGDATDDSPRRAPPSSQSPTRGIPDRPQNRVPASSGATVSGEASLASGEASLRGPLPRGIVSTGALLGVGLLLGVALVRSSYE